MPASQRVGRIVVPVTVANFVETAENGHEPLLGYVALEQSQAMVDMARHRLVKVRHLDLKGIAA